MEIVYNIYERKVNNLHADSKIKIAQKFGFI